MKNIMKWKEFLLYWFNHMINKYWASMTGSYIRRGLFDNIYKTFMLAKTKYKSQRLNMMSEKQ